jgi:hypothetical protein
MGLRFAGAALSVAVVSLLVGAMPARAAVLGAPLSLPLPLHNQAFALAVGDVNGDGIKDVAVAQDGGFTLFMGTRGGGLAPGRVVPVDGLLPWDGLVMPDLNGDGRADLVTIGHPELWVGISRPDGTFDGSTKELLLPDMFTTGLVTADFNRDGRPDLVVTGTNTPSTVVLLENGDGTFNEVPSSRVPLPGGGSLAVGDFNRDGKLDLVQVGGSARLYLGDGRGGFSPGPSPPPKGNPDWGSAGVADFDGNGSPDLALAGAPLLDLMFGHGDGTFDTVHPTPTHETPGSKSIAVGDLNGDRWPDVAVNEPNNFAESELYVFLNRHGEFALPYDDMRNLDGEITNSVISDLTGDSKPDLAVAARTTQQLLVFPAQGTVPPGTRPPNALVKKTRCHVPNLRGMTAARAKRVLLRAHCRLGRVSKPKSDLPGLRIVSQAPRPRASRPRGQHVRIRLAQPHHR